MSTEQSLDSVGNWSGTLGSAGIIGWDLRYACSQLSNFSLQMANPVKIYEEICAAFQKSKASAATAMVASEDDVALALKVRCQCPPGQCICTFRNQLSANQTRHVWTILCTLNCVACRPARPQFSIARNPDFWKGI